MEIPPGGLLFQGARDSMRDGKSAYAQSFCIPVACEYKKFKFFYIRLGLSVSNTSWYPRLTEPVSIEWQSTIHRYPPAPTIVEQKAKSNH